MDEARVFAPKTVGWLIAVGFLAFAGAAYFAVTSGDPDANRSSGANAFSTSAIGHRGLVETLRGMDIPVVINRSTDRKAGPTSLLVVLAPPVEAVRNGRIPGLASAGAVLWVLPKWNGRSDAANPRWVDAVTPVPISNIVGTVRGIAGEGTVVRVPGALVPQGRRFDVVPTLEAPQLMRSDRLGPVIASADGMLVGEFRRGRRPVWILSDPDIVSNHGLGRGDNAVLALRLVEALRPEGGTVFIDETVHGFAWRPSLWRSAFEFPFVLASVQALIAIAVLMWAASARFGAPVPTAPPFEPGKTGLIDNTAALLGSGGHGREILMRYVRVTLRDVARRLHLPRHLDEAELIALVERIGQAHGVDAGYRALQRDAEAGARAGRLHGLRLTHSARNLYRWKQEMIHGPRGHRRDRPPTQGRGEQDDGRAGGRA